MQRCIATDKSGSINVVWFNQPFLTDSLANSEKILLAAKIDSKAFKPQLLSPEYEIISTNSPTHLGRITPVYGLTGGIKQKWLRTKIKWLTDYIDYIVDLKDELPKNIIEKYDLIDKKTSLKLLHFPDSNKSLQEAKKRVAFDEMLSVQIILEKNRLKLKTLSAYNIDKNLSEKLVEEFINSLPFTLTSDQLKVIDEIKKDICKNTPMRRLLQGDVGSGKTIISIIFALITARNGYDTAIMAPTSVLAKQLFDNFQKYLKPFNTKITLSTQNSKNDIVTPDKNTPHKNKIDSNTQNHKGYIRVGTHALLFRKESLFSNLGLVIIDEQHRFGVKQRNNLLQTMRKEEKKSPHYLIMTATPIPRTIAQTYFNDMKISTINSKPKERIENITYVSPLSKRRESFLWIKKILKEKNQVFWVCPLIEESDLIETKSVNEVFDELKKEFPEFKIGLLHGKLKEIEKQNLLEDFQNQKIEILVSTSVIEVGIDIKNANLMVIEGAERFGLAQLHQLRGRVGRNSKQSYCLLFPSSDEKISEDAIKRLKYFAKEKNGFKIAEYDLSKRGPGEVYGYEQSGIPEFKIAKFDDFELISATLDAARIILNQ